MNKYLGNDLQTSGVIEYRLMGGKADGMRMLRVRNSKGLDFDISLDRAADISMLSVDGVNMGFFAPCGYVHPAYYNNKGVEFLKSFTAGFFTTCGLTAVGTPNTDEGEELPLHGTISNTPSEKYSYDEDEEKIVVCAKVVDAWLFGRKLVLERKYTISKKENVIKLEDKITNKSGEESPLCLMYHCNMGYPLLSENAIVKIPSKGVLPRNDHAAEDIENCLLMEKPQKGFEERCYYHDVLEKDGIAKCGIFNPDINKGLVMSYKKDTLGYFTEWKMMGETEYVLGLEPANCTPDGRNVLREKGVLKFIAPGEEYKTLVEFRFVEDEKEF